MLRARHKALFEQVWAHWENLPELAKQAKVALDTFGPLLKADENRCAKEKRERWTKFKEAVAKGEAAGFRIIKEKSQENWAGEKDVSNVAQLTAQAVKWASLWASQEDKWDINLAGIDLGVMEEWDLLTAKEIRDAARSFKKRTTAVEGWHPRHFGWLSDDMLNALSRLWHVCETQLVWPSQEEELLAKLIPKASGGLRPIMWYRSMFRVYSRARRPRVQQWFASWAATRPEVNMAPGRHTTDAIWRSVVRQETSDSGTLHVEWNWDLQKAFDYVKRDILWSKARAAGYPMKSLATALVSYGWGRRFILNREVSKEIRSGRGIAAGSVCAV